MIKEIVGSTLLIVGALGMVAMVLDFLLHVFCREWWGVQHVWWDILPGGGYRMWRRHQKETKR